MDAADIQKRKDRTITLSIETKVREFPGKVLLSCFLAEKGFRVILTNDRKYDKVIDENSWLFIDRNTFASRKSFFKNLRRSNIDIACLDEEGIVWANPLIYLRRLSKESLNHTSLFFTWGKKQSDLVNQLKETTRVVESGNPRMDLLRPELRGIYQDQVDDLKEKYGDFVLIVSNFAWNNHYYVNGEKENPSETYLKLLRHQGHIQNKEDEQYHLENLEYKTRVFDKLKKLVLFLGKELPDVPIIVRPHPSENHKAWRDAMKEFSNIQVVFEGELEPWIMAAQSVIHNSCTSGVQAALVNRKSIAYMPFHNNKFEHEFPNDVSAKAYTHEEVLDLVKEGPLTQEIPKEINEYISSLTGPFASERIADTILEAYIAGIKNRQKNYFKKIVFNQSVLLYKRLKRKLIKPKKFTENREDYKKQKLDSLTSDEVDNCVVIYNKLLKRFGNIASRNIENTVEITMKQ
ncbi:surface carbohydrate biosynthesis protein [Oceanispirochaeta sp.]|jgi:surface carbohydrate biosynthesis protein|uniref:surface carbohydrate biosynthesis protein n=1 Tax=Oceanispirochaeta sp. TaxID=2035350 RepID=UPI0026227995|nr:surface carbohydrate biosynthesis protein [Oceanispirochaeta sp.]MDA3955999.1 hypothetical protein [Oceanispirochaeta sp.]